MATICIPPHRQFFYYRTTIPKSLRHFFGGRLEYWRTLNTTDPDIARLKSAQWETRVRRVFVTLKMKGKTMTVDQIEALISRWIDTTLEEAEDYRAICGPVSDQFLEDKDIGHSVELDATEEMLRGCDYRRIAPQVDDLLQSAGLPLLEHSSVEFGRVARQFLLATQEVTRIESDRWNGIYRDNNHTARSTGPTSSDTAKTMKSTAPTGPLFSVVSEKFMAENPRAARTAKPLKAELLKFIETIGGDRPIAAINKADGRAYKEALINDRKLSGLTVVKHLSALSALWRWAEQQGYVADGVNPMRGLAPNKRNVKKNALQRRPFTDEELLMVFGSDEFKAQRDSNPERFWMCLICLFEVCRREEAGQLPLKDLQEQDGIAFFDITDKGKDQGLKNEGSRRRLPIHSSLIQLGFMEYVERIKKAGHDQLFPQAKKGGNGYSDATGKWFSRLVTKMGLTDPALVLHSLRHGGITKLHGAGCPHNVVELLVGHSAGNVHEQYIHKDTLPLSLLLDGLERLRYEEVVQTLLTAGC